jgi:hypothetical protein
MTISSAANIQSVFPEEGWFEALREAVATDAELAVIGRWCTLDLAVIIDEQTVLLRLREGKIAEIVPDPDIGVSWSITLRGTLKDWMTFLQPVPPRFYSDLLAMNSRIPSFTIEGDRKMFVRHLHALSRIFRVAQQMGGGHA